jgi:hypothetical protein
MELSVDAKFSTCLPPLQYGLCDRLSTVGYFTLPLEFDLDRITRTFEIGGGPVDLFTLLRPTDLTVARST